MNEGWRVIFAMSLIRRIAAWERRNRNELLAIQRLVERDGPEGLGWDAKTLAQASSWEAIGVSHSQVFWTAFEERFYRVALEIRPGKVVIFRDAACGVSRFWR